MAVEQVKNIYISRYSAKNILVKLSSGHVYGTLTNNIDDMLNSNSLSQGKSQLIDFGKIMSLIEKKFSVDRKVLLEDIVSIANDFALTADILQFMGLGTYVSYLRTSTSQGFNPQSSKDIVRNELGQVSGFSYKSGPGSSAYKKITLGSISQIKLAISS